MTSNMYRVGDYVYFETSPNAPYQIRRIEELNKTSSGNVEAKVMCYFRRRDIPSSLLSLADKHQILDSEPETNGTTDTQPSPPAKAATSSPQTIEPTSELEAIKTEPVEVKEKKEEATIKTDTEEDKEAEAKVEPEGKTEVKDEEMEVDEEKEKEPEKEKEEEKPKDVEEENEKPKEVEKEKPKEVDKEKPKEVEKEKEKPKEIEKEKLKEKEKPKEKDPVDEEAILRQKTQINQRELFLSKQVEILPANNIRGKCCVTLLNETESFSSYIDKDDAFFYTLVYDPVQRTLLADRGEIRVGSRFQAEITHLLKDGASDGRNMEELEVLMWTPEHGLCDREIDQFLVVARSVGTFARALDCSSSVKQPSLHMSAAAASRDITLFHAMDALHQSNYDLGKAMCALAPPTGPILCRDQMEEWSASEANLFEEAMEKYGKDFKDVRNDFLPWKITSSMIEYYYLWKTTDRYVQQKRVKAVEAESKLKQVYIPPYNKTHPAAIGPPLPHSSKNGAHQIEIGLGPGKLCECCSVATSVQWYAWAPPNATGAAVQPTSRLCQSCWSYWKKYGDLTALTKVNSGNQSSDEDHKHGDGSRPHRCSTQGCGKEFILKSHLLRHSVLVHGLPLPPGSPRPPAKTRTAFYLAVTPTTRLARRFCVHLLRPRHAARFPFLPISTAAIRQDFQMRMARKTQVEIQSLLARAQKPLTPLRPPKRIRVADLTFRLARGQIQSTTASWLILPDRSLPKAKLAREAFPKPPKAPDGSLIYERIVLPHREAERIKRRPDDSPSDAPPYKRSARESPGNVTSPLSVLAPLSGLAMGMAGSPSASAGVPFLPNLPLSQLRANLPPELYVSALTGSSGMAPLIPGAKASPSSATISPTGKASLLPSAAPVPMTGGRSGRSHGSRGSGLPGHSGGRVKQLPTWMDAPDDLFFHSTQITKKLRRRLATQELRRAARKPWRQLNPRKAS